MKKLDHALSLVGIFVLACIAISPSRGESPMAPAIAATPYVFTDGVESIRITNPTASPVAYTEKVITTAGWGPTRPGSAAVVDGAIAVAPLAEGINIVTLSLGVSVDVRYLAITPPVQFTTRDLPANGDRLLSGKRWKFVAIGDSVTSTGDYPGMLKMLLERATGNKNISFVNNGKFGMTVDYAVRMFPKIVTAEHPDAVLVMFGLNDQREYDPEAYIAQYEWLGTHIHDDAHADTVFLQPTPHFAIPGGSGSPPDIADWYVLRTAAYGRRLYEIALNSGATIVPTFDAVWGNGGGSLIESLKSAWPILPRDFNDQFSSELETNGVGDPVHINALGQLQIAKAVFAELNDIVPKPDPPLQITATSEWTKNGMVSHVTVGNHVWLRRDEIGRTNTGVRTGIVEAYPLPESRIVMSGSGAYSLKWGQSMSFDITWPDVTVPSDLLKFPNLIYLAEATPMINLVDYANGQSRVYTVNAPFIGDAGYKPGREIVEGASPKVNLLYGHGIVTNIPSDKTVALPNDPPVGRIPVVASYNYVDQHKHQAYAAAEVAYARFGAAVSGEATVDGDLSEWAGASWIPIGVYPTQARWIKGPEDYRSSPSECNAELSLRAGKAGMYLAGKVTGLFAKDSFILYFDPRSPGLLGTPGGYYWLNARFKPDGTMDVSPGETTTHADGLAGVWKLTSGGATFEMFVPYSLMDTTNWPPSGDLGFSCWWQHMGPTGKVTNLMWFEDGFPWTPLWYGVVRLTKDPQKPLPYVVRLK